jgi:hypothetical protein
MSTEKRRLALYRAHSQVCVLNANDWNDSQYQRLSVTVDVDFQLAPSAERLNALDLEQKTIERRAGLELERIANERAALLQDLKLAREVEVSPS